MPNRPSQEEERPTDPAGAAPGSRTPPPRPPAKSREPSSWQARLDAARKEVSGAPPEDKLPPDGPPPLRPRRGSQKPAHLALSQLDALDTARRTKPRTDDLMKTSQAQQEIAEVSLDLPTSPPKRRRIPDWAVVLVLALGVIGGAGYFAMRAGEAPKPVAKIDPKLEEQLRVRKKAMSALEEGHRLAAEGGAGFKKAVRAYRQALSLDPKLSQAERGLAIAYSGMHKAGVAVKHYRRYLEMEPGADDAAEVRKIIKDYEKHR